MRIITRHKDLEDYLKQLEAMVTAMATDIAEAINASGCEIPFGTNEIIEDYKFVVSEPSIIEEILYEQRGTPYLEKKSIFACFLREAGVLYNSTTNYIKD